MLRPVSRPTPSIVAWLGYGGLVPFVSLAAVLLGAVPLATNPGVAASAARLTPLLSRALFGYGAVILSFVGAVHWGFAMTLEGLSERDRARIWLWSVVPALLAWVALLLDPAAATATLVLGFAAHYAQDLRLARRAALPGWYLPLRFRLTSIACVCLALVGFLPLAAGAAAATPPSTAAGAPDSAPAYRQGPASADGIGKFYDGREIAQVMGFDGAPWLDRPTREHEERPDLLVRELHLTAGMTVADIGAGSGYLSRRMAPWVGAGTVYAVDVQPAMVALLRQLSQQPGFGHIVPVQGTERDVNLPAASVDLAILVDVYHELAYPYEVMQSLVRAVKPGGRIVLVEYRGEDPAVPIKALHKMGEAQVRREMSALPLTWERTSEVLPVQHILVFRRR